MTSITATTYPAHYADVVGNHRLVGWGDFATLHSAILMRTFGFIVQAAMPVVKEFHGDLFYDAEWLRREFTQAFEVEGKTKHDFMVCVRHSGTQVGGGSPRLMFESLAYDAALYLFEVQVDGRGEWHLSIDLLDARPDRP